jgi:membrane protease YdiL (CAAX protease family)
LRFVLALLYYFLARVMAQHGARGLVAEDWAPLVEQAMFAFLLLLGYAAFGFVLDRQLKPLSEQGLSLRTGWLGELGLGLAFGWAAAVVCVLVVVLFGGLALHFSFNSVAFGWLIADAAYFALATLAVQVAFRGYPFQSAIGAIGDLPATLIMAVLYGILRAKLPGASNASMGVSIMLGLLLGMAYLRTRSLWVPWGLHFGWVASRALVFGLPISGVSKHSPVVQGDPLGSFTLAGANFGLDGSWLAFFILLLAMPFLYRATRELDFRYNAPVLIPGGIAVDLDAAARSQHEAATRPDIPEVKPLVQILPAGSPPLPVASDLDREPLRPSPNPYSEPES